MSLDQRHPRQGVEQWVNLRNGLTVVRLHYSADPRKRSEEWKAKTSSGMHPRAWRREYEIDWASPAGEPVIPEYREETHCRAFEWDPSLRLLRFWDFGFVSPVCLFAQLTLWGQLRIRRELCPFNTPLNQLLEGVRAMTMELGGIDALLSRSDAYDVGGMDPDRNAFDAGDPAGENHTDLGCSAEILGAAGITLHTTRPGTEVSYAGLRARFLRSVMDPEHGPVPAIILHPDCQNLRAAAGGAFHLDAMPPYKPKKSHPEKDLIDALRYGEDNLRLMVGGGSAAAMRKMAQEDVREMRSVVGPPNDTWADRQNALWRHLVESM